MIIISLFGVGLILSISLGMVFSLKSFVDSLTKTMMGGYNIMVYSSTEEGVTEEKIDKTGIEFEKLGVSTYSYGYIKGKDDKYVSSPLLGLELKQAVSMKMLEIDNVKDIKENIEQDQNEKSDDGEIKVGSKVVHTFFGYGIVVEADDRFIKVLFEKGQEIKKLTKNHPTITKIKN